jgi:hypothetical protein
MSTGQGIIGGESPYFRVSENGTVSFSIDGWCQNGSQSMIIVRITLEMRGKNIHNILLLNMLRDFWFGRI